ncbi:MAG: dipeptidase [Bacteroidetes bacterium]|nr:dipeptidase [Bacteroidota bacterium]
MIKNLIYLLSSLIIFIGCNKAPENESLSDEQLRVLANELAQKFIITDGHIDLPERLDEEGYLGTDSLPDIANRTATGDFDYVRAKTGGLDAPFMSIYIPSSLQVTSGAKEYADSLINIVEKVVAKFPAHFDIAKTPGEAEEIIDIGKISLPMGMENGAAIGEDLSNIAYFKNRGISYITLTHATDNQICDSSYDTTTDTWNGLSEFGEQVVKEMNRLGIMVDISHVSDSAFYDVMALTDVPAIASHSSCRYFTPGWERNMNDDMIKILAEKGGVIMISFGSTFLDMNSKKTFAKIDSMVKEFMKDTTLVKNDPRISEYNKKLKVELNAYTTVERLADHFDHAVKIAGIDHVGIGSDFEGVGDSLPEGMKDVSQYPNLIYELLKRGYSEEDIEKICYKNLWRVWNEVLEAIDIKS